MKILSMLLLKWEGRRLMKKACAAALSDRDRMRLIVVAAKLADYEDEKLTRRARRAIENWRMS